MSLTRLSVWRDGSPSARTLLHSLVTSFTEGFDTKDLKDAKALLNVRSYVEGPAKGHIQRLATTESPSARPSGRGSLRP